jgi:sugar O-acyltransferase (sialic acid O-acetyltransferase NeuD family)
MPPSHETPTDLLIVGAGGHGAVVLDIVRAAGAYRPVGFIDADPALVGKVIDGVPVLGALNLLPKLKGRVRHAVVAIGDNRVRRSYAQKLTQAGFELANVIHPSAFASPTAVIGRNIVMAAGSIIGTAARVADSVLLNTAAVIDHECEVGEGVHLGPGCKLAGRVRVAAGAFIGMGACVIQCLTVGEEATVGAGAIVVRDVEPRTTVVGVPAREMHRPPLAKCA